MLPFIVFSLAIAASANAGERITEDKQNQVNQAYEGGKDMAMKLLAAMPDLKNAQAKSLLDTGAPGEDSSKENKCPSTFSTKPESNQKAKEDIKKRKNQDNQILVFVSFSMPFLSLKNLAAEAEKYNAKLIIRGLIENSFKKTAEKLKDFESGLEINPKLFKEYHIDKAPTFVLLNEGKEQHRLAGNVSLSYAATKLKEPA